MRLIAVAAVLFLVGVSATWSASGSLAWSRGRIAVSSYDFATVGSGSRTSRNFMLTNVGRTGSGRFALHLTGSSAFSIRSTGCTGKNLGVQKSCRVTVRYAPSSTGANHAVLTATRKHRMAARLKLSGCSVDASNRVFWADWNGGTVKEAHFGAGCATTITTLATGQSTPASVAVDGTHVYWVTAGGEVKKVPLGGGTVTTLASGQDEPLSVAVDGTHVYWVNAGSRGYNSTDGSVNKVPLGGGAVTTLASGQAFPISVAVDGTHVYWVNADLVDRFAALKNGTVNEVPLGGGAVTTLASGQNEPWSVAVDSTNVYWVNSAGTETVNKVPVGGGTVTTLANDPHGAASVAVSGTDVYWVDFGGQPVNVVPIGGGAVTQIGSGVDGVSVAVNGTHVFWGTYGGVVYEAPLGGGPVNVVASGKDGEDWPLVAVGP